MVTKLFTERGEKRQPSLKLKLEPLNKDIFYNRLNIQKPFWEILLSSVQMSSIWMIHTSGSTSVSTENTDPLCELTPLATDVLCMYQPPHTYSFSSLPVCSSKPFIAPQ